MRVLWVTAEPPDRHAGGSGIRQSHLIEALSKRADIDLLLVGHLADSQTAQRFQTIHELEPAPAPAARHTVSRRLAALIDALRALPPEVSAYRGQLPRLTSVFEALARDHAYDRVVVDHIGLAQLVGARPRPTWAVTFHNVASGTLRQEADLVGGRRRLLLRRQAAQAREFERWAMRSFGTCFSVCAEDAEMLPGPSVVVPNGVEVNRYDPTPIPKSPRIVMVGTLGYRPNVDGITWFVDQVLPRITAVVPETTLTLVGRQPVDEVYALAQRSGIELQLDVPDVRPYLAAARMTIVPLRFGTGTRLKALEAFAAGRPVVGTTIGLAGLDVVSGNQAIVADDPAAFAEGVVEVLTNDAVATRLAAAGRAHVEQHFDWPGIGERFAAGLLAG